MSDSATAVVEKTVPNVAELQGILRRAADLYAIEGIDKIPDDVVCGWTEEERLAVQEFCTIEDHLDPQAPKCLWTYMGIEDEGDESEFSTDPAAILDEPAPPGDPVDVDRQNAEWIKALRDAEQTCKSAEAEYLEAKEAASEAKKYLDGKIAELRRMIDRGPDRQAKLPFVAEQGEAAPAPVAPAEPIDESWRAWPIQQIDGLKPGHVKSLAEAGIENLGQLTDHVAKHGDFWAKEIAGIGPKAAEVISESLEQFWRDRPDQKQKAAEAHEASEPEASE